MQFKDFLGKTITAIEGAEVDSDEVRFTFSDGTRARMYHWQDCCEGVCLADIAGNVGDLIGSPLLMAEESTNSDNPQGAESSTWTFYLLATINGFVTLRWVGESNGYYGEGVDVEEMAGT